MPERVIVVGGGIAGLTVARDLALAGRDVVLLESSDRLGGQVVPLELDGITTDAAAESFATRGGGVAALLAELGLGDDVVTPRDDPAWLFRSDGSSVQLPATSVLGIPGVPMAADVIAAIGWRAALRAQLDALIPSTVGLKSGSFGELVRRRMGRGVLDGLVAPVVRGVHSTDPDSLPVGRAHPQLLHALRSGDTLAMAVRTLRDQAPAGSQVAGLRGGVWRLTEALAAAAREHGAELRTGVRARWTDETGVTLATGERIDGRVVLAAAGLTATPADARRITLVTLVVDAPELDAAPRGTGVLVAADAPGVRARALTHATAKWAWLREQAGDRHVLRLSYDVDGSRGDPTAEQAAADAAALTGARIERIRASDVSAWTRSAATAHAVDGMDRVGEAGAVTGLAAVVAGAREVSARILGEDGPEEAPE